MEESGPSSRVDQGSVVIAHPSMANVLAVPLDFIAFRIRNRKEAELILEIASSAQFFDRLLHYYELIAGTSKQLKEAWNLLWLAEEPLVMPAVPLIGEQMSYTNKARAVLLEKMESELQILKGKVGGLLQFAEMNTTIAEELLSESVHRLSNDKLMLADLEREIASRINAVCQGSGLANFRPIVDIINDIAKSPPAPPAQALRQPPSSLIPSPCLGEQLPAPSMSLRATEASKRQLTNLARAPLCSSMRIDAREQDNVAIKRPRSDLEQSTAFDTTQLRNPSFLKPTCTNEKHFGAVHPTAEPCSSALMDSKERELELQGQVPEPQPSSNNPTASSPSSNENTPPCLPSTDSLNLPFHSVDATPSPPRAARTPLSKPSPSSSPTPRALNPSTSASEERLPAQERLPARISRQAAMEQSLGEEQQLHERSPSNNPLNSRVLFEARHKRQVLFVGVPELEAIRNGVEGNSNRSDVQIQRVGQRGSTGNEEERAVLKSDPPACWPYTSYEVAGGGQVNEDECRNWRIKVGNDFAESALGHMADDEGAIATSDRKEFAAGEPMSEPQSNGSGTNTSGSGSRNGEPAGLLLHSNNASGSHPTVGSRDHVVGKGFNDDNNGNGSMFEAIENYGNQVTENPDEMATKTPTDEFAGGEEGPRASEDLDGGMKGGPKACCKSGDNVHSNKICGKRKQSEFCDSRQQQTDAAGMHACEQKSSYVCGESRAVPSDPLQNMPATAAARSSVGTMTGHLFGGRVGGSLQHLQTCTDSLGAAASPSISGNGQNTGSLQVILPQSEKSDKGLGIKDRSRASQEGTPDSPRAELPANSHLLAAPQNVRRPSGGQTTDAVEGRYLLPPCVLPKDHGRRSAAACPPLELGAPSPSKSLSDSNAGAGAGAAREGLLPMTPYNTPRSESTSLSREVKLAGATSPSETATTRPNSSASGKAAMDGSHQASPHDKESAMSALRGVPRDDREGNDGQHLHVAPYSQALESSPSGTELLDAASPGKVDLDMDEPFSRETSAAYTTSHNPVAAPGVSKLSWPLIDSVVSQEQCCHMHEPASPSSAPQSQALH